jgi:lysophospholipid acyltransferase (LPLAT)-like uncharacterized protein
MKLRIRHPLLIKAVGFLVALVVRLWIGSLRLYHRPLGFDAIPRPGPCNGARYLFAFWHEDLLVPTHFYSRPDLSVMISEHADGKLIAEACRHLRVGVVAGSTTRGSVKALRKMRALAARSHLAMTPDGPRGPRRKAQPGIVYLAAQTGLPIVPVGFAYHAARRLSSWDRFALPLPFSAVMMVSEEPISVPRGLGREELEAYRARVEAALERASAAAEELVKRKGW